MHEVVAAATVSPVGNLYLFHVYPRECTQCVTICLQIEFARDRILSTVASKGKR